MLRNLHQKPPGKVNSITMVFPTTVAVFVRGTGTLMSGSWRKASRLTWIVEGSNEFGSMSSGNVKTIRCRSLFMVDEGDTRMLLGLIRPTAPGRGFCGGGVLIL